MLAGILFEDAVEPVVHDPALSLAGKVVAFVDDGTGITRRLGGVVGARVRHHEDVDQFGRIVLVFNRLDEVGDHRFLVMGGDEERIAMLLLGGGDLHLAPQKSDEEENDLVQKAPGE